MEKSEGSNYLQLILDFIPLSFPLLLVLSELISVFLMPELHVFEFPMLCIRLEWAFKEGNNSQDADSAKNSFCGYFGFEEKLG